MGGAYVAKPAVVPVLPGYGDPPVPPGRDPDPEYPGDPSDPGYPFDPGSPPWNPDWPFPGPTPPGYNHLFSMTLTGATAVSSGSPVSLSTRMVDAGEYVTVEPSEDERITWTATINGKKINVKFSGDAEYNENIESDYSSFVDGNTTFYGIDTELEFDLLPEHIGKILIVQVEGVNHNLVGYGTRELTVGKFFFRVEITETNPDLVETIWRYIASYVMSGWWADRETTMSRLHSSGVINYTPDDENKVLIEDFTWEEDYSAWKIFSLPFPQQPLEGDYRTVRIFYYNENEPGERSLYVEVRSGSYDGPILGSLITWEPYDAYKRWRRIEVRVHLDGSLTFA